MSRYRIITLKKSMVIGGIKLPRGCTVVLSDPPKKKKPKKKIRR
jgi:hypothetical protein